ncbi:hypothetical protein [Actinopolymorpha pittospori]|uniref:Uncharacterized protein n=1 Tax=Actinopolymorpha pittospori TaxID=648752 RepID=A0A927N2M7_9ACTN|nr:hypothetical protein [Actinopolymorpha pittospori]MBE1611201.1 hypothetical protein [Actinopolymorpha pittospori]
MSDQPPGRRGFLRGVGASALAWGGAGLLGTSAFEGWSGAPALATTADGSGFDYTARDTFDTFDRLFHDSGGAGQPDQPNEAGGLAWGQSYVLAAFMRMYAAYRDTYYLDRLVHNTDLVLGVRDSARGVTDYTGRSQPAWRAANPYTVGAVRLTDDAGLDVLEVRSALTYADQTTATVRAGSSVDRFTLEVSNARTGATATFADVTMDPASADYVVRRVYDAYPTPTMVTARDLRPTPTAAAPPRWGAFGLTSQPVIFAVHTGMITYPIATFVATVYAEPRLRRRYGAKAAEYLEAVRAAVAVHDPEWEAGEDGLGAFRWPKGMPVPYDGTVQPINQSVALGRTYLELVRATRDSTYRDRAARLARMFAGQIEVDADQAAIWHYWPTSSQMYTGFAKSGDPATDVSAYTPAYGSNGVGAQQYEDTSHGAIEADFAVLAHRAGVHFQTPDLERLARTYTRNLATTTPEGIATTYVRVDGSGGLAPSGQYLQAPRWMAVAWWDRAVFTHARAIYDGWQVQPSSGSLVLCVAELNWYARRGN